MDSKLNSKDNRGLRESSLFNMSGNAFRLINEGRKKEAHENFPLESYVIEKYHPENLDELEYILGRKLGSGQ